MRAFAIFFLCLFLPLIVRAEIQFPALSGRVVDDAHILSSQTKRDVDVLLARHEQATGHQIVVVTLHDLQGQDIEEYGYQLGRHWGIGQKGKNNGVLLIVAPTEHQVRIEVGYGLEGELTDALSKMVIERAILPPFKAGDMDKGVRQGATAIVQILGGEQAAVEKNYPPQKSVHGLTIWHLLLIALYIYLIVRRRRYGFVPVFIPGGRRYTGGGFGGGGFSGGGGSFGGGGASGRW